MLSAIAARKAAAAAAALPPPEKPVTSPKDDVPKQPPSLSQSESDDLQPPSPPRKRKAEGSESPKRKRQKKRTKFKNVDFGRPRYFDVPQAIEGFDDEPTISSEINEDFGPVDSSRAYSPSRPIVDAGLPEDQDVTSRFPSETPRPRGRYSPSRPIADSSEDEDPAGPSKTEITPSAELPRTSFTPRLNSNVFQLAAADLDILRIPSDAARINDAALVLLNPGQSLSFVGSTYIILVQGSISILGTPITPSLHAHRVFSPRSSPIASLEALDVPPPTGEGSGLSRGNSVALPARVQIAIGVSDSVVVIQTMQTGVEGLGKIFGTFDGVFEVDQEPSEAKDSTFGVEGFHFVNPHASPNSQLQCFFLPESWSKALDAVLPSTSGESSISTSSTSFVALVRGPKKCGKSTFARTLLNRLTTRYKHVAFLECDLGQSEFTPGGMVSLHVVSNPAFGPPFTHPRLPYRAHYVGNTTPHSSPSQYLSSIQALVQLYRLDIQYAYQETLTTDLNSKENKNDNRIEGSVPLVVNTQGWIKGLGGDLLRKIEEIVGATHVFDFDMHNSMVPRQRMQLSSASVHVLQPIPSSPLAKYYNSADHRSLAILSYFYCVFPSQHIAPEDVQWVTDLPLCARQPWAVDCTEAIDQIVLIGAGYEDVVSHELGYAINCGVVGLVCDEDPSTSTLGDSDPGNESRFAYMQGALPPEPTTSHCLGLALVRGVDSATGTLHMLTPLPIWALSGCRVLIKGELELPVWGMLDFREGQDGVAGVPWGKVPYLQMSGAGTGVVGAGAGRKRVRRNLMRRSQM